MSEIGQRIRELRQKRNWTLNDLSARTGVSFSMLGHIENGRRSGTADTLEKIADAFNLRIGVLIDPDYDLDRAAEISRIVEASSHLEDDQLRVVLDMIEALKSSR